MGKFTAVFSFVLGLLASGLAAAGPTPRDEIRIPLSFPPPILEQTRDGKIAPRIEGLFNTMEAGLPSVPVKTLKIALPFGTTLGGVALEEDGFSRDDAEIAPAASQIPLSWLTEPPAILRPVEAPRFRGSYYPENKYQVSLQYLHGVPIAVVNVYPFRVAHGGRLSEVVSEAVLRVGVRAISPAPVAAPLLPYQLREVQAFVDNPDVAATYGVREESARGADAYDYLIISTSNLIEYSGDNSLSDLEAGLAKRKLRAKVVDLSRITDSEEGVDAPEKIRNFIRQEYKANGIRYVLLAGRGKTKGAGAPVIPARRLWSKVHSYLNGHWVDVEETIPSDMYYACLDGSYNGNGNDKWGEPDDGDKGGDVDFLAEVTVGRAALESTDDLQNFVRKTTWTYEHPLPKRTLLLGESLFPEMGLTGSDYLSQLVGGSSDHGFTTKGYTSDWTVDQLDDKEVTWTGADALSKIASGDYSMVNHLGHSNQSYNMRLSSAGGLPDFTNPAPFFHYTQGCLAGRFIDGSFVDKMVRHPHAAVAAVANSTYGLAPEDPAPSTTSTPGASNMLHRQFINALMTGTTITGRAHQLSKEAFIGLKSAQEIRWVDWAATFLGDPSLELEF